MIPKNPENKNNEGTKEMNGEDKISKEVQEQEQKAT